MSQRFYDHPSEGNYALQERLGSSRVTLNRESAVLGTQTRSLLQMLGYGLDSITTRAASHLLNMDVLHSNTGYLLKLCEGLLLNSIESVTPPHLLYSTPLRFSTQQAYTKYSVVGTVSLLDGTPCSLILYRDPEPTGDGYIGHYCAGAYVHQAVPAASLDFTPGTMPSVYVPEQYKSVWTDSLEVELIVDGGEPIPLECHWSFDGLLTADPRYACLCQHTPRGITVTLGDGEVFGQKYNTGELGNAKVLSVEVSYIKCESLADADASTLSFNEDITPIGAIPTLTKPKTGDTAASFRSRAIAEFFAAGKITNEHDMEVELNKIPIVKSAHVKREYDYPLGKFTGTVASLEKSIEEWQPSKQYGGAALVRAPAPAGYPAADYIYLSAGEPAVGVAPSAGPMWLPLFPLDDAYTSALQKATQAYPSYQVYDNATLVVTGLVLKSRHYYAADRSYHMGDTVYYPRDSKIYKALSDTTGVAPDDEMPDGQQSPWADASQLPEDPAFDAYEEITQAMFELELKHYFGIWQKLGFLSVVVEPLHAIKCDVTVSYSSPYPIGSEMSDAIANAVCWRVGHKASLEELNSALTEKFSLSAVSVTITYTDKGEALPSVGYDMYVRRSGLSITLQEI